MVDKKVEVYVRPLNSSEKESIFYSNPHNTQNSRNF